MLSLEGIHGLSDSETSTPSKRIMPACKECGANVALDENFCGGCGARVQSDDASAESAQPQTDLSKSLNVGQSTWQEDVEPGSGTGEIDEPEAGATSRAGEESPRRSKPKALTGGKVLNNR